MIVPLVKVVIWAVASVPVPSVVTSVWLSVASTGSRMVPPLVAWREEPEPASESSPGSFDRSIVLAVPSAVKWVDPEV